MLQESVYARSSEAAVSGRCPVLEWFCSEEPLSTPHQSNPFGYTYPFHFLHNLLSYHSLILPPLNNSLSNPPTLYTTILMHLLTFANPLSSFLSTHSLNAEFPSNLCSYILPLCIYKCFCICRYSTSFFLHLHFHFPMTPHPFACFLCPSTALFFHLPTLVVSRC